MVNDEAALEQRLKDFGRQPVDPEVAAAHLSQWHVRVAMYHRPRGPRVVGGRGIAALMAFVVGGVAATQFGGVGVAQRPELGAEAPPATPHVGVRRVEPRAFSLVGAVEHDAFEGDAFEDEAMAGFECDDPAPSAGSPAGVGGSSAAGVRAFAWFRAEGCSAAGEDAGPVPTGVTEAGQLPEIAPPASVAPPVSVAPPPASVAPPVSVAPPPASVAPPVSVAPPPASVAPPASVDTPTSVDTPESPASGGETADSGQPSGSGKESDSKKSDGKKSDGKKSDGKKSGGKKSDAEDRD